MESEQTENPLYVYDIVKVEIEENDLEGEKEEDKNFLIGSHDITHPELTFTEYEVTSDPRTGMAICLLCLEDLQPQAITEHMVTVHHYRRVTLKCWICGQLFQDKDVLYFHKQGCQPKKRVKRPSVQQLIREADDKYKDTNVCPICLVEVTNGLKEHLVESHSRVVVSPVTCPVCQKLFKSNNSLCQHVKLVHQSTQGSVECPECGQTFASNKYMTNHMRNVHPSDGVVHRCEECGKGYKSHQSLYQHVKYVHLLSRGKKNNTSQQDTELSTSS